MAGSYATRPTTYETASALVARQDPNMGMAPWPSQGRLTLGFCPPLQSLVRPCISTCRSALSTVVEACCCHHRRLQDWLGRVCNRHAALGSWTGPRLQWHINWRVASSTARSSPVLTVAAGQACTGLDGQHSDGGIYQPPGRCTLPSHVTTRPLSPPL